MEEIIFFLRKDASPCNLGQKYFYDSPKDDTYNSVYVRQKYHLLKLPTCAGGEGGIISNRCPRIIWTFRITSSGQLFSSFWLYKIDIRVKPLPL